MPCPYGQSMADANDALPIDPAIQQVRNISYLLHAPLLDQIALKSALQCDLEGFTQRSGIEVVFDRQPSNSPRLASELETAIAQRQSRADGKLIGKRRMYMYRRMDKPAGAP